MPTYTYAIESCETDGAGRETWVADPNFIQSMDYSGTADQFARRALNHYLADVASDAELIVGQFGSEPCCPTRILVWEGTEHHSGQTAAELRDGMTLSGRPLDA